MCDLYPQVCTQLSSRNSFWVQLGIFIKAEFCNVNSTIHLSFISSHVVQVGMYGASDADE